MAIYKGATPINQLNLGGQAITSVYKGDTKIWPAGGAYYGVKAARVNHNGLFGALLWGSDPAMIYDSGPVEFNSGGVNFGSNKTVYGITGCTANTTSGNNLNRQTFTGYCTRGVPTTVALGATYQGTSGSQLPSGMRILVSTAEDDALDESVARFNAAGTLQWGDRPGWSCVYDSIFRYYTITAPGPILMAWGNTSEFNESAALNTTVAHIDTMNLAAGTFTFIQNSGPTSSNTIGAAFSAGVILA